MSETEGLLAWFAVAAAGLAGGVYLFGKARAFFKAIEKAAGLLTSELTNNSGTSMKDNVEAAAEDLHGIAVAVGILQRTMNDQAARIEALELERQARRRYDNTREVSPAHRAERE
jgi:ABC-type sugar transport system substrate-binding protein